MERDAKTSARLTSDVGKVPTYMYLVEIPSPDTAKIPDLLVFCILFLNHAENVRTQA